MLDPPKPKFKKVKLPQTTIYRKIKATHKNYTPNLRLSKLYQIEKEGVEVAFQIEYEQEIQNLTIRHVVNTSLI